MHTQHSPLERICSQGGRSLTAEVFRKILKTPRVGDSSAEEDGHKDCGEKAAACRRYVSVSWRPFSLYIQEQT